MVFFKLMCIAVAVVACLHGAEANPTVTELADGVWESSKVVAAQILPLLNNKPACLKIQQKLTVSNNIAANASKAVSDECAGMDDTEATKTYSTSYMLESNSRMFDSITFIMHLYTCNCPAAETQAAILVLEEQDKKDLEIIAAVAAKKSTTAVKKVLSVQSSVVEALTATLEPCAKASLGAKYESIRPLREQIQKCDIARAETNNAAAKINNAEAEVKPVPKEKPLPTPVESDDDNIKKIKGPVETLARSVGGLVAGVPIVGGIVNEIAGTAGQAVDQIIGLDFSSILGTGDKADKAGSAAGGLGGIIATPIKIVTGLLDLGK